jgi:hypothetical protein
MVAAELDRWAFGRSVDAVDQAAMKRSEDG